MAYQHYFTVHLWVNVVAKLFKLLTAKINDNFLADIWHWQASYCPAGKLDQIYLQFLGRSLGLGIWRFNSCQQILHDSSRKIKPLLTLKHGGLLNLLRDYVEKRFFFHLIYLFVCLFIVVNLKSTIFLAL